MTVQLRKAKTWWVIGCSMVVAYGAASCSSGEDVAYTGAGVGDGGAAAGGTSSGGSSGSYTGTGGAPTEIATCQGHIYECGDLEDNDGDGLIDSQDPDCLGPCDNTEDSYYGGIPGQNSAPCKMDCYFDQDTGHGNDNCNWAHWCDPNSVEPHYYPEPDVGSMCAYDENKKVSTPSGPKTCAELDAEQPALCNDFCGPLTPNGCDCFGCCELPAGSGSFVWLGSLGEDGESVCTMADIADPTKCHPCKPVNSCLNGCGTCELCLGKTELPEECYGGEGGSGGAPQECGGEYQPCGLDGQDPCPADTYCVTGCCVPVPK